MTLVTLLSNQGSTTQTITLNRLESTAQIYLPTVIQAGGTQTITLNLLGSTAQIFLPTINLVGAITDTSDILVRYRKKRSESKEEEEVAAQLLKARQKRPQVQKQRKELTDWKRLIYKAINGADSEEELQAISVATIPTDSPEVVAAILAEIEQRKEKRKLELQQKLDEAQQQITKIQEALLAAEQAQQNMLLELQIAEEKAAEFTRKRNNRIKRLKALMWLAKLDL